MTTVHLIPDPNAPTRLSTWRLLYLNSLYVWALLLLPALVCFGVAAEGLYQQHIDNQGAAYLTRLAAYAPEAKAAEGSRAISYSVARALRVHDKNVIQGSTADALYLPGTVCVSPLATPSSPVLYLKPVHGQHLLTLQMDGWHATVVGRGNYQNLMSLGVLGLVLLLLGAAGTWRSRREPLRQQVGWLPVGRDGRVLSAL